MAKYCLEPQRAQLALLPGDMMDWLPGDDIVRVIVDVVTLTGVQEAYKIGRAGNRPIVLPSRPRLRSRRRAVQKDHK